MTSFFTNAKKPLIFLLAAGLGCFLAAILAEPMLFRTYSVETTAENALSQQQSVISFALRTKHIHRDKDKKNNPNDDAVRRALTYFSETQRKDGSWEMGSNEVAATALAALAFQGYGVSTTTEEPIFASYKPSLIKAWQYLLEKQDMNTGCFQGGTQLYSHAICAIALAEHLAMSKIKTEVPHKKSWTDMFRWSKPKPKYVYNEDPTLRNAAQKSVDFLVKAQSRSGGWRYTPNSDSDLSVTGWVVIALFSARAAGLDVPEHCFDNVRHFLDSVQFDNGSKYGYTSGYFSSNAMVAEGLLCRILLGWEQNDPRLIAGVKYLYEPNQFPNFRGPDSYYWYYVSQTLHHFGGERWAKWDENVCSMLVENQNANGSWTPPNDGHSAGVVNSTALSVLVLETNYRHESVYDRKMPDKLVIQKAYLPPLLQVILWSVLLCFGMAVCIVMVQNHLMRKPMIEQSQLVILLIGAVVGGIAAGFTGNTAYDIVQWVFAGRLVGWVVLGAILALGMSFYIANLDRKKALIGGSVGGLLGVIGFALFAYFGEMPGRIVGATILGACIGFMIGFVELFYRNVWLMVLYDPRDFTQVNLGSQTVTLGSGKYDTIFIPDVPEKAGEFSVHGSEIRYTDASGIRTLEPGRSIHIGGVELVVCSKDVQFSASKFYPMKMSTAKKLQQREGGKHD
ncbi:MAG: hypothetical protein ACRC10_00995 [Thermoguttaceae bacterium]